MDGAAEEQRGGEHVGGVVCAGEAGVVFFGVVCLGVVLVDGGWEGERFDAGEESGEEGVNIALGGL